MGKEVGHKCVRQSRDKPRFSIFYCGCKQPKSIHISFIAGAKVRQNVKREK